MSWFSTSQFHFELPGDQWEERTLHLFRPLDQPRTAFAISRFKGDPLAGGDVEAALASLPAGPYEQRELVQNEARQVGPLDARDIAFIGRSSTSAEYYRVVSLAYYELELSFQWAGPIAERAQVDERAERALANLRFRKR